MTHDLGAHWFTVLVIIFAAVLTTGFKTLEEELRATFHEQPKRFLIHAFVSLCLVCFILYDLGALVLLFQRFPYRASFMSGARFLLDVGMSFLLFVALMQSVRLASPRTVLHVLVCLTLWHGAAAAWHVLASLEIMRRLPDLLLFLPHFYFPIVYWAAFGIWRFLRTRGGRAVDYSEVGYMFAVASAVLGVAVYRTLQLIERLQPTLLAKPLAEVEPRFGQSLPENWLWVISVLYGGILAIGYEEFEKQIRVSLVRSRRLAVLHAICAICVTVFFLYVFAGYPLVTSRFPYTQTPMGAVRYIIDFVMAFLLLALIMPVMRLRAGTAVIEVLVALTFFHIFAALWYSVAFVEESNGRKLPDLAFYVPHFGFVSLYWLVFFVGWAIVGLVRRIVRPGKWGLVLLRSVCASTPGGRTSPWASTVVMLAVCLTVCGVAIFRTVQLIKLVPNP